MEMFLALGLALAVIGIIAYRAKHPQSHTKRIH